MEHENEDEDPVVGQEAVDALSFEVYQAHLTAFLATHSIPPIRNPLDNAEYEQHEALLTRYLSEAFATPWFFGTMYGAFLHPDPQNPMDLFEFQKTVIRPFVEQPYEWQATLNRLNLEHMDLYVRHLYESIVGAFEK